MQCPKCQTTLEVGTKFCTSCGAKVTEAATPNQGNPHEQAASVEQQASSQEQPVTPVAQQQAPSEPNAFVEQTKEISKGYWAFLPGALMHPFATSKKVSDGKGDLTNAIITIALFSLFLPLFTYITAQSYFSGTIFSSSVSFTDLVLKPFFMLLIFFAALTGVKFGVAQLMKANVSFVGVLTRFASMLVLPMLLAAAGMLFNLLSAYTFSGILIGLALAFTSVTSIATLFSLKETAPVKGGLDVFYGVIITYTAMTIILLIIGDAFLGQFIDLLY